jgi:RNA polymerase sigma-70 factor (ECF subfamily)
MSRAGAVNGSPGLVFEDDGGVVGVMAFTVAGGLITEIDFVVNPDKLRRVDRRARAPRKDHAKRSHVTACL